LETSQTSHNSDVPRRVTYLHLADLPKDLKDNLRVSQLFNFEFI
jgi:hypothetical protein